MRETAEGKGRHRLTRHRLTRRQLLEGAMVLAGAAAGTVVLEPSTERAAAASPAPAPAPAGELKVSLPSRIVGLDPLGTQAAEESVRVVADHVFDTLVVREPKTRGYKPSLAMKWESPDPTTWVFTLRSDVKFHDGSPIAFANLYIML